jgi:hypothetical protein
MKYLKTYENIITENTYKIGDWVFLKNYWAGQHLRNFIDTHPAKIIGHSYDYEYDLEYLSNPKTDLSGKQYKGKWILNNFASSRIIRFATPEEIETEILNDDVNKYNI